MFAIGWRIDYAPWELACGKYFLLIHFIYSYLLGLYAPKGGLAISEEKLLNYIAANELADKIAVNIHLSSGLITKYSLYRQSFKSGSVH